ncbi:hypothetical protein CKAH01_10426 [Colletotrichum kahawae]|uniref:Uncharacterized protein n=1 Tax=Colletotrichum kahawae TaxID=34407 RepID=A0AAD9XW12_COLKA|nr:hypothetical protein CKAH01_10426 [Colletotrichum kahawae]
MVKIDDEIAPKLVIINTALDNVSSSESNSKIDKTVSNIAIAISDVCSAESVTKIDEKVNGIDVTMIQCQDSATARGAISSPLTRPRVVAKDTR